METGYSVHPHLIHMMKGSRVRVLCSKQTPYPLTPTIYITSSNFVWTPCPPEIKGVFGAHFEIRSDLTGTAPSTTQQSVRVA